MMQWIGFVPVLIRRWNSLAYSCYVVAIAFILQIFCACQAEAKEQTALARWVNITFPAECKTSEHCRFAVLGETLLCFLGEKQSKILTLTDPEENWQKAILTKSVDWNSLFDILDRDAELIPSDQGLICCGGRSANIFILSSKNGALTINRLKSLPEIINHCTGTVLNDVLYIFGEVKEEPTAKFSGWSCSLSGKHNQDNHWKKWQLPVEVQQSPATMIEQNGSLYLFQEQAQKCYQYHPNQGWKSIELSFVLAQELVAMPLGASHIFMADSVNLHDYYLYHTITDTWRRSQFLIQNESLHTLEPIQKLLAWRHGILIVKKRSILFGKPQRTSKGLQNVDLTVFGIYLLILVAMSFYFKNHEKNCDDYFLAGQRIPWWAAGLSLLGSSMSAITFMAFPAMSYRTDWVYLIGNFMILAVAPLVIWFYLPFYRRLKVTSAYEYLEYRFGVVARLLGSATFLLFQLGRMGVVVYLPALALSAISSWNVYVCIIVIGSLATLYTTLGGIEAVIWTDVLQVIVLIGGAILSLVIILSKVPGGSTEVFMSSMAANKLHAINYSWDIASTGIGIVIVGNFFKFLIPYSSDQGIIQRYLTTNNEKQAARGIWLNATASIPVWTLFFALGTGLWAFYRAYPEKLDPIGRTDEIFAWFIIHELPVGIAGFVVAGLFAASMSSLDTSLNSMATAITTDFYRRFFPKATDHSSLRLARYVTMVLGIFGTLMAAYLAWYNTQSIWDQFLKIMGLFGGGLAGMFVAGIFTQRTTQTGILIGFITSAIVLYFARTSGSIHFFLYGAIGILTCSGVGWLMSQLLPGADKNLDGLTVYSLKTQVALTRTTKIE